MLKLRGGACDIHAAFKTGIPRLNFDEKNMYILCEY